MTQGVASEMENALQGRRRPVNGWVYFLMESERGLFKIGQASDVTRRLAEVQTGSAEELVVFGVMPAIDPIGLERAVHRRFRHLRQRGEWFKDHDNEIERFVERYCYELDGSARIWCEISDTAPPSLPPRLRL